MNNSTPRAVAWYPDPYMERVELLLPEVLEDLKEGMSESLAYARLSAVVIAVGRLSRYAQSVQEVLSVDPQDVDPEQAKSLPTIDSKVKEAVAALGSSLPIDLAGKAEEMLQRAVTRALSTEKNDSLGCREVLDLADAACSIAAYLQQCGVTIVVAGPILQVARLLDERGDQEFYNSVQREANDGELYNDPIAGPMWRSILSPDELPREYEAAGLQYDVNN